jgi:hypothetical protein
MSEANGGGRLSDGPLYHWLLRCQVPGLERQLDQIAQLRTELNDPSGVVPLEAGTFRLRASAERLRQNGLTGEELLQGLRDGLDVVAVKPPREEGRGLVVEGVVRAGGARRVILLGREVDLSTPGDWRLARILRARPDERAVYLRADWRTEAEPLATPSGDARQLLGAVEVAVAERMVAEEARRSAWQPAAVTVPLLGLHVLRGLREQDARAEDVTRHLTGGGGGVFVTALLPNRVPGALAGLRLWLPDLSLSALLYPPRFPDAGPNDLLLAALEDAPAAGEHPLAELHAVWRRAVIGSAESFWRDEVDQLEEQRRGLLASHAPQPALDGGHLRLRVGSKADELQVTGYDHAGLCAALSAGALAVATTLPSGDAALVVQPDGSDWAFLLQPWSSRVGPGDWKLIYLGGEPTRALQPFARVRAGWVDRDAPPDGAPPGDGDRLLGELAVLQEKRSGLLEKIQTLELMVAGNLPGLESRVGFWRAVTELEKEEQEVGLARLRDGGDETFLLTPANEDAVRDWLDPLLEDREQGVEWERHPLRLEIGTQYENLTVDPSTDWEAEGELTIRVRPARPQGMPVLQDLCRQWEQSPAASSDPWPEWDGEDATPPVRLYLPNTQLNRIREVLDWFDPGTEARRQQAPGGRDFLSVDPLTLQTLRRVLTDPAGLEPVGPPPDLPLEPLARLSAAQRRAVALAVHGPDLLLIQGPPGTGKTTVIVEILRQLFWLHGGRRDFKVLLVAPTHVAVDNVLERLVVPREGGPSQALELGVTPYRLGSTKRIARHLQGFTHDCFHSSYVDHLEQAVAQEVGEFEDNDLDEEVREILRRGERADARGWTAALASGEWPTSRPIRWPKNLEPQWREAVRTQEGRALLWRQHAPASAEDPEPRRQLLRDWLRFVRDHLDLFNQLQLTGANLVCATTVGCATSPGLRGLRYDYVIVDEAGKEEARKLLVPLLRGDRWVLVGDHQQLPPHADDSLLARLREQGLPEELLTRSLFEELQPALADRGRFVFLDHQGRMHPDVSAFVSQAFYGGQLLDFDSARERTLPAPGWLPASPALQLLDTRGLDDRGETRAGNGYVNHLECELTVHLLRAFADHPDWAGRTLGVIAPYRRQVEALEGAVGGDEVLAELLRDGLLQLGTVDSFQGQERDLIVFCCTRSNAGGKVGFVDNLQRMNVALSRARSRLLVVADGATIERSASRGNLGPAEQEVRKGLVKLLEHAQAHGGLVAVPEDWREEWR